jgi:hypothetical protein
MAEADEGTLEGTGEREGVREGLDPVDGEGVAESEAEGEADVEGEAEVEGDVDGEAEVEGETEGDAEGAVQLPSTIVPMVMPSWFQGLSVLAQSSMLYLHSASAVGLASTA